jgi:hypothetical protein
MPDRRPEAGGRGRATGSRRGEVLLGSGDERIHLGQIRSSFSRCRSTSRDSGRTASSSRRYSSPNRRTTAVTRSPSYTSVASRPLRAHSACCFLVGVGEPERLRGVQAPQAQRAIGGHRRSASAPRPGRPLREGRGRGAAVSADRRDGSRRQYVVRRLSHLPIWVFHAPTIRSCRSPARPSSLPSCGDAAATSNSPSTPWPATMWGRRPTAIPSCTRGC